MVKRQHTFPSVEYKDEKRFEATNGDQVSIRFEVIPIPGAVSVKAIIDALELFAYNIEINLSEAAGDITVRENDDAKLDSPVAQHRLTTTVGDFMKTDMNNVMGYRPGTCNSTEQELDDSCAMSWTRTRCFRALAGRSMMMLKAQCATCAVRMTSSSAAAATPTASSSGSEEAPRSSDETRSTQSEPEADAGAVAVAASPKRARRTAKKRAAPKPKKPKIRTNEVLQQREALVERQRVNNAMCSALHAQRLSFASTLSMVTQFFRQSSTEPFDLPARLGKDPFERQAALLKMKHDRLQVGHQFMLQRQHYLSTAEFCDRKKFEATNGDLVSMRFEILPLPGARSVKAIIDALQFFVYNIEISISEAVGDITVRENDDAKPESPVAQHRLVATVADLVQTDTNNVAFAEYRPAGPPGSEEQELGLMICDAVDEDDLFPYRPQERVRQDMTQITMVAWHQSENGEPIIVMTQWWCLRIRKSDSIYVPPFVVDRIRSGVEKVGTAMLNTARRAGGMTL
ncbi:unnamed protein product [Phytophthora lilii]|uniref:Unnamed protein product n=1 Tax=Phytophthora lilii TaxID=2077276 RepID=A0A9W6TYN7_9STRA|nr:unnamed protein product [Phytophthora lilii]